LKSGERKIIKARDSLKSKFEGIFFSEKLIVKRVDIHCLAAYSLKFRPKRKWGEDKIAKTQFDF
jgi:hypothetical protein